jgi:hypothetical protein
LWYCAECLRTEYCYVECSHAEGRSDIRWARQGDQKIRKINQFFSKIAQKVAKSKKAKNIYNKAQFESPKHLQQTTFGTLKVAKLAKNRPIWLQC